MVRDHTSDLGKDDRPLERSAMQGLTLVTMAVLRVDRVAVELKRNVSAPTLSMDMKTRHRKLSLSFPIQVISTSKLWKLTRCILERTCRLRSSMYTEVYSRSQVRRLHLSDWEGVLSSLCLG